MDDFLICVAASILLIIGVFFCLALCSTGGEFNPQGYADWRPAETLVELNVRTGPGQGYEIVDTLPQGAIVEISRESSGVFEIWGRVRFSEEDYDDYWICKGAMYDDYIVFLD